MGSGSAISFSGWAFRRASLCCGVSVTSSAVASTVEVAFLDMSCSGEMLETTSLMIRMGAMDDDALLLGRLLPDVVGLVAGGSRSSCLIVRLFLFAAVSEDE